MKNKITWIQQAHLDRFPMSATVWPDDQWYQSFEYFQYYKKEKIFK